MVKYINRIVGKDAIRLNKMMTSFIEHESIVTTQKHAKRVAERFEQLVNTAKRQGVTPTAYRVYQKTLNDLPNSVKKINETLVPRYQSRNGGYVRMLRLEPRLGDNAPQAVVEMVDGNKEYKFWMTARVVARLRQQGENLDQKTKAQVKQVTQGSTEKAVQFEEAVKEMTERFYPNADKIGGSRPLAKKQRSNGKGYKQCPPPKML
ncbi:54S ribosomal protein L8 [Yarrowia sp. C11]|nr:54S ribosomal protein L8 [Yarrowia sp. E02]KAG5372599.1 54S ribosomal protein L8 [Yarrowia sp. C11]